MDYDLTDIPTTYDRGHDHGPAVLEQWISVVESHLEPVEIHRILDLTCGTGRFAPSLADRFNATVIGFDPSQKMLRQAQRSLGSHDRVRLAGGYGEPLSRAGPLSRSDLHLDGLPIANYPYLPFFPASRTLLEQRLPTLDATCAAFEAAAFCRLFTGVVVQQIAPDYATYADKFSSGADSEPRSPRVCGCPAGLRRPSSSRSTFGDW